MSNSTITIRNKLSAVRFRALPCSDDSPDERFGWECFIPGSGQSPPQSRDIVPSFTFVANIRHMLMEARIRNLERAVQRHCAEIEYLRVAVRAISAVQREEPTALSNQTAEVNPRLSEVVRITQEMFQMLPTVEFVQDPEDHTHTFVVFTVRARGSALDIVRQRIEWHDRVDEVPPGASGILRLSIVPIG